MFYFRAYLPNLYTGILNQTEFKYKKLDTNNSGIMPMKIQVEARLFGNLINVTLNQVQDLWKKSSLNNQVYMKSSLNSEVNKIQSANLVFIYYFS
jgi:hypothetical protein